MEGATESPCIFFEMCNYHGKNKFHSSPKMLIPTQLRSAYAWLNLTEVFQIAGMQAEENKVAQNATYLFSLLSKLMTLK